MRINNRMAAAAALMVALLLGCSSACSEKGRQDDNSITIKAELPGDLDAGLFYYTVAADEIRDTKKLSNLRISALEGIWTPVSGTAANFDQAAGLSHRIYVYSPYSEANSNASSTYHRVEGRLSEVQQYNAASGEERPASRFCYGSAESTNPTSPVDISVNDLYGSLGIKIRNSSGKLLTLSALKLSVDNDGPILAGNFTADISKAPEQALKNTVSEEGSIGFHGVFRSITLYIDGCSLSPDAEKTVWVAVNAGALASGSGNILSGKELHLKAVTDKGISDDIVVTLPSIVRGGTGLVSMNLKEFGTIDPESMGARYPAVTGQPGALVPDGKTDALRLIERAGYYHECPDSSGSHKNNHVRHITQVMDDSLARYVFRFDIHIDIDDDRGIVTTIDRQRNEIKTWDGSPANMVASSGETHTYTWKFKLPVGFQCTRNFCHIHQIKGYGGDDVSKPIITYCPRNKNGKTTLQLIHYASKKYGDNKETFPAEVPLEPFIGSWVMATEKITYGYHGKYEMKIVRMSDDKVLMQYSNDDMDLWREGMTAGRPKYGIYRYFGDYGAIKSEMRDESLLFTDFTLKEEK